MRRFACGRSLGVLVVASAAIGGCRPPAAPRAVVPCWLELHRGAFERPYPHVPDERVFPGDESHLVAFCGPVSKQDRSQLERSLRAALVTATELSSGERRRLSVTGRHPGVMASRWGSHVSGCIRIDELPPGRWAIRLGAGPDAGGVGSAETAALIVRIAPPESPRERRALAWRRMRLWGSRDATVDALKGILITVDADPAASDAERFMIRLYLAHVLLTLRQTEEALRYSREAEATAGALGDAALQAAREMRACADILERDATLPKKCKWMPHWPAASP